MNEKIKQELQALFDRHGALSRKNPRRRPKTLLYESMLGRNASIERIVRDWETLGILPTTLEKLTKRHVLAVVALWKERSYTATTRSGRRSCLRILLEWLNRPDLIGILAREAIADPCPKPLIQSSATKLAEATERAQLIEVIRAKDPWAAHQLVAMAAFALTKREVVIFRPCQDFVDDRLIIGTGVRDPRRRIISDLSHEQRVVLDELKAFVEYDPKRTLVRDRYSPAEAIRHLSYVLGKAKTRLLKSKSAGKTDATVLDSSP